MLLTSLLLSLVWCAHTILISIIWQRYYSNAFTDMVKQDAMNVFLGKMMTAVECISVRPDLA